MANEPTLASSVFIDRANFGSESDTDSGDDQISCEDFETKQMFSYTIQNLNLEILSVKVTPYGDG